MQISQVTTAGGSTGGKSKTKSAKGSDGFQQIFEQLSATGANTAVLSFLYPLGLSGLNADAQPQTSQQSAQSGTLGTDAQAGSALMSAFMGAGLGTGALWPQTQAQSASTLQVSQPVADTASVKTGGLTAAVDGSGVNCMESISTLQSKNTDALLRQPTAAAGSFANSTASLASGMPLQGSQTVQTQAQAVPAAATQSQAAAAVLQTDGSAQTASAAAAQKDMSVSGAQDSGTSPTQAAGVSVLFRQESGQKTDGTQAQSAQGSSAGSLAAAVSGVSSKQGAADGQSNLAGGSESEKNSGSQADAKTQVSAQTDSAVSAAALGSYAKAAAAVSATDTAQAQNKLDTADVARQISSGVQTAQDTGRSEIRIHLSPENLGGINIRIVSQGGSLSLQLTADSHHTGELLASSLGDLNRSMQDSGVNVGKTEIFSSSAASASGSFTGTDANTGGQQSSTYERPKWRTVSAPSSQAAAQVSAASAQNTETDSYRAGTISIFA